MTFKFKIFIILVMLMALNIIQFNKTMFNNYKKPKIHACLRTKDSLEYIDELIKFHTFQGITSFNVYDDSEKDNFNFFVKYPHVAYQHVGGVDIPNENYYIWECMSKAFTSNLYDYVLNMDDDEFIYPIHKDQTIATTLVNNELWFNNAPCIANPVFFFGTVKTSDTGMTSIDFVNRDRSVSKNHTKHDPDFAWYVSATKTRHVKKRIEKAIFKNPTNANKLLTKMKKYVRHGVLIHGYGLNCLHQRELRVAHYTRGDENLKSRILNFWKGIHGLRNRFSTEKKINNYVKQRNRTEYVDETVRSISKSIYKIL